MHGAAPVLDWNHSCRRSRGQGVCLPFTASSPDSLSSSDRASMLAGPKSVPRQRGDRIWPPALPPEVRVPALTMASGSRTIIAAGDTYGACGTGKLTRLFSCFQHLGSAPTGEAGQQRGGIIRAPRPPGGRAERDIFNWFCALPRNVQASVKRGQGTTQGNVCPPPSSRPGLSSCFPGLSSCALTCLFRQGGVLLLLPIAGNAGALLSTGVGPSELQAILQR